MQFIFLPLTFIVFYQIFDSADLNILKMFDLLQISGYLISVASSNVNLENKYLVYLENILRETYGVIYDEG